MSDSATGSPVDESFDPSSFICTAKKAKFSEFPDRKMGEQWIIQNGGYNLMVSSTAENVMAREDTQNSWFRELREDADLTQEFLAVHLGVALSTLRRWEKGNEPSLTRSQWLILSEKCKVPLEQLFIIESDVIESERSDAA